MRTHADIMFTCRKREAGGWGWEGHQDPEKYYKGDIVTGKACNTEKLGVWYTRDK